MSEQAKIAVGEESGSNTVKGIIDGITFRNEENGYTICTVDSDGEPITVVGCMPAVNEGEYIYAAGEWKNHPSYGRQFCVEAFKTELPATAGAILSYLSSGVIKGIGPVTAKRIVDKYGEESLTVIGSHPEYLADIKGISPRRVKEISESFNNQYGMRQVMLYFEGMLSPRLSIKAYKKWGNAAVDLLRTNPYLLCEELEGIGFEKADAIAKKIGIPEDSDERIAAGIKYLLSLELSKNGNCYVCLEELVSKTARVLGVRQENVKNRVAELSQTGEVVAVKFEESIQVYSALAYRAEKYCADKLNLLYRSSITMPVDNIDDEIDRIEAEQGISLAPLQREAIKNSVMNGVAAVTGGPGTGKTTVIRAIIEILRKLELDFCLAAPTGRAAKRMSAGAGFKATTIHRLLECRYGSDDEDAVFGRDEDNLLEQDAVIIDEASMVDVFLFSSLLRAIRPGTRLIIIGDADQLPPVGAGDVFGSILRSGCLKSVRLTDIFRQAQGSSIVTNAHMIKDGKVPTIQNKGDCFFMKRGGGKAVSELVLQLCSKRLPDAYGFDPMSEIQVICPSRKGETGTVKLNVILQEVLNPPALNKIEYRAGEVIFRRGDKVMAVKNNYDIEWTDEDGQSGCGIFNGDIGVITDINRADQFFTVRFDDGRTATLDYSCFEYMEHAYAITVHKSQGSEYKAVIIPLFDCPSGLLTRSMLYTALTRAEKLAILAGKPEIMEEMVLNVNTGTRNTGLERMLKAVFDKK